MNPLFSIWFEPRKSLKHLIDNYDPWSIWLLAVLGGIKESFNWVSTCNMGQRHGIDFILILVILVGPPLGITTNWAGAFFTKWIGGKFGGKGSQKALLTVIVWSSLPVILMVPFWFLLFLGFGDDAFSPNLSVIANHSGNIGLILLTYGWLFLKFVAIVWSFIIMLVGISDAQGFTKWGAFGNTFAAALGVYAIFGFPIYWIFHL